MEEKEQSDRHWGGGMEILLLAMVPILYVFLLGPAVRWHGTCPAPVQTAIEYVYAPLEWLHDNSTPLRGLIDSYVDLWEQ